MQTHSRLISETPTMVSSVEEVTSSLVREYLSRKGLKGTIACMDEELPRTHNSINNRSELREILHVESLYEKNKVQQNPLKTLLEIIIKHHIEGHRNHNTVFNEPVRAAYKNPNSNRTAVAGTSVVTNANRTEDNSRPQRGSKDDISRSFPEEAYPYESTMSLSECVRHTGHDRTDFWSSTSDIQKDQPLVPRIQESESFIKREREQRAGISESHNGITENAQKNRTHTRIRRGMMAGPVASSSQETSKKRQSRRASVPHPLLGNEEDTSISTRGGPSMTGSHERSPKSGLTRLHTSRSTEERQPSRSPPEKGWSEEPFEKDKPRKAKSLSNQNMDDQHLSEMILDDIDDDEELRELSTLSLHSAIPQRSYDSYPMDLHTAIALKEIFLGSSSSCFSTEWRNQGFTFSETPDLTYGIVQKKGGPCGVLASIQACVLKKLLFEGANGSNTGLQGLRPSFSIRRKCLMLAAAEVLWRAGEQKQATIAITSGRNHFIPPVHFKSEGVFEKIMCITVDNLKDLQLLLEQHIQLFENGALGCILLTISAVLSRSIDKVRDDMDVPTTTLIGAHGYCTQELVNLLLCGSAVSNVFDNDMELDSGNGNLTLLKGIKGRCDIGLLSLFEHYNICKVGAHLQTPRFPIWMVCSESHFSVLFGLQRELLTNQDEAQDFDLYYYDGLANQQEEIRLTVSVGIPALASQDVDPDLIPPLEHCIRTKWKDAVVNWNSTEPIL